MQLAIWIHLIPTQDFPLSHMSSLAIVIQKDCGIVLSLSLIVLTEITDMLGLLVKVSCLFIFNKGLFCHFAAKCEDGDVRLNGSRYNNIGAVQVCIDGEWSSVCGASFDRADATVVCTHLGFYANG